MKNFIKATLASVGWELRRLPRPQVPSTDDQVVKIGDHAIRFPAQSRIPQSYNFYPNYGRELALLTQLVTEKYPNAIAVDVGANVGDTIALIRQKSAAKVYAFEGDPTSLGFLRANAATLQNVEIVERFLDETLHTATTSVEKSGWNNTLRPTAGGTPVEFTTLDSHFKNHPAAARIKLVKIDCEGFDARILRGGHALFATSRPAILFEYHARCLSELGEDGPAIFASLANLGYTDVVLFDHAGDLLFDSTTDNAPLLRHLDRYIRLERSPILYLDAVCFHRDDADLARQMRTLAASAAPSSPKPDV